MLNTVYDSSTVFENKQKLDNKYEELKEKGELTDEEIFKLNYAKTLQIMKLNTGYFRF